ncbi:hypothetical protein V8C37DRAFT_415174 [Trichoderma ceciliae]
MTLSIQDVVRILRETSSFIPGPDSHEAGIYIVAEDSNELSELRWVESQLAGETLIGSDVRSKTPAVYVAHGNKRAVFCVGENNALKLFRLEDQWHEIKLSGNGEILVHSSSHLSGSIHGSDSLVFFEDTNKNLQGVRIQENGSWEFLPPLPASSIPGSPHYVQVQDDTVFLGYVHQDGHIHRLAVGNAANNHPDSVVLGTKFTDDSSAVNFILGLPNDPEFQVIALTKGEKLVCVDGEGKKTEMGGVVKGVYFPLTGEENNKQVSGSVGSAVSNATRGVKK